MNKTQDPTKSVVITMALVIMALVVYLCVKIGNPFLPPVTQAENQVIQAQQTVSVESGSTQGYGEEKQIDYSLLGPNENDPVQTVKNLMMLLWTKEPENVNYNSHKFFSNHGGPRSYIECNLMYLLNQPGAQPPTVFTGGITNDRTYPGEVSAYIDIKTMGPRLFMIAHGKSYDMECRDQNGKSVAIDVLSPGLFIHTDAAVQQSRKEIFASNIYVMKRRGYLGCWVKDVKDTFHKDNWVMLSQPDSIGMGKMGIKQFLQKYGLKEGDIIRLEDRVVSTTVRHRVYFGLSKADGRYWRIGTVHAEEAVDI